MRFHDADRTVAVSATVTDAASSDGAPAVGRGRVSERRKSRMATVEECEQAMHSLAAQLSGVDADTRNKVVLDRSITCRLRDLDVVFAGQLRDGELHDIRQVDSSDGQVRLSLTSDDLLELTSGQLNFASAWASGRLRVDASIFDLLKLRSLF
jgi:SCP-2 sterol transfer family